MAVADLGQFVGGGGGGGVGHASCTLFKVWGLAVLTHFCDAVHVVLQGAKLCLCGGLLTAVWKPDRNRKVLWSCILCKLFCNLY